ncbi:MAG: CopG family transcriptional regulator [Candidatus Competibacteraceae bacterium]
MSISVHLDKELEQTLRIQAARAEVAISDFIREAIKEKLARMESAVSPYELGKDSFGKYSSGQSELSANRKKLIRERLHAQHRR